MARMVKICFKVSYKLVSLIDSKRDKSLVLQQVSHKFVYQLKVFRLIKSDYC